MSSPSNSETAGKLAAEYYLDKGFKEFAYCGVDQKGFYWSQIRSKAFYERLTEAGFQAHVYKQPNLKMELSEKIEKMFIADWLKSLPIPVGLMACNDNRGRQVLEACRVAGLRVPEDVAILGVDNDEVICTLCYPALSSVNFNTEKAGYDTAEMLDKMIAGKKINPSRIVVEPTHIVSRQSTDTLAMADEEVAKALRYIRENVQHKILIDEVVNATTTSRRQLQERFQKIIGHSILDEIKRAHADHIAHMLRETNMSLSRIASTLGFSSIYNLSRFFRQEKGVNASTYRKKFGKV